MKYQKQVSVAGKWVKASEIQSGVRAKLITEATPTPSQFKDEDGEIKMQDVSKIRFENIPEAMNISLNRATMNGLIDAFGDDSKNWINKYLTAHTEKMIVGGRRVTALYLIPEGFEISEDENGYMVIKRKDSLMADEKKDERVDPNEESIRAEDIPF